MNSLRFWERERWLIEVTLRLICFHVDLDRHDCTLFLSWCTWPQNTHHEPQLLPLSAQDVEKKCLMFESTQGLSLRKPLVCENLLFAKTSSIETCLPLISSYKVADIRSSILAYRNLSLHFFRAYIVRFSLLSLLLNNFEKIALRKK